MERIVPPSGPRPAGAKAPGAIDVVAEQVLVKFTSGTSTADKTAALAARGWTVLQELSGIGWTLAGLPSGMSVVDALSIAKTIPAVELVEGNMVYAPIRYPSDPSALSQYGLSQINAAGAWEYETGSTNLVTVAVIDTGIEGTHPDLQGKILVAESRSWAADGGVPAGTPLVPACSHGTQVAGVAAAMTDNAVGIAGVSWGAKLVSLKVFNDADCASDCASVNINGCGTSNAAVANALDYARTTLQNGVNTGKVVVNMSLGCTPGAVGCPEACPASVRDALNAAVVAGIPVFISAGNDGGAINNPAACASVIAAGAGVVPVGATDEGNNIASFSSRGPALASHGLVAPGKSVLTTTLSGGYATASGTSFSAPHAAGVAALILAARPAFTPAQVQATLRGGSEGIGVASLGPSSLATQPMGNTSGAGRLNAFRSMRLAVNGTLAGFDGEETPIAFPNPFKPTESGAVSFAIPQSLAGSKTKIKIFTVTGELVRELNGLSWDGKNTQGHPVASGTYIFLVSSSAGTGKGRLAVVR